MIRRFAVIVCCFCFAMCSIAPAAVVSSSTPTGLVGGNSGGDNYIGVVTAGTTATGTAISIDVGGSSESVTLHEALGAVIEVGDVVGRDIDDSGSSSRLWSYAIALPGSATPGTGLTNIAFSADMLFSASTFDGVGGDTSNEMTFSLFLNGSSTAETSFRYEAIGTGPNTGEGPVTGLTHAGGASITSAIVTVEIESSGAFNTGNENFALTNAVLSADFEVTAVPEPAFAAAYLVAAGITLLRRRRDS